MKDLSSATRQPLMIVLSSSMMSRRSSSRSSLVPYRELVDGAVGRPATGPAARLLAVGYGGTGPAGTSHGTIPSYDGRASAGSVLYARRVQLTRCLGSRFSPSAL